MANGIKYNHKGGSVTVSCVDGGAARLRITVTDNGPGILASDRDLLFMPFERLGAERTAVEGTGVGLALSRRLAEVMDGTVDVESEPGRGSTFWLELTMECGDTSAAAA